MTYTVWREVYRYGREDDPTDFTWKEFPTYEKAMAYGQRYAKGLRFASFSIEDENGNEIYWQSANGNWDEVKDGKKYSHTCDKYGREKIMVFDVN